MLQYTNPVMIILYLAFFKKVRPKAKETLAVLLALGGIFLLSTNGNLHTLVITPKGLFMGLLCAVFTCFYSILPGRLMEKYDEVIVCGWSMFIGGIALAIWKQPVIPFISSLKAIMLSGPMYANVLASIEPVIASVLTFIFLGTTFGGFELLGFCFIILTIIILSLNKKEEA